VKRFLNKLLRAAAVLMILGTVFLVVTSYIPWFRADQAYSQGRFDEAVRHYGYALFLRPDSPVLNFNMGAALYRKGDYKRASSFFNRVAGAADEDLRRMAHFNLGNCRYRLGRNEGDREAAVRLYKKSLADYDRALAINAGDADAVFNKNIVDKALEELFSRSWSEDRKPGNGDPNSRENPAQSLREQKNPADRQKAARENLQPKDPAGDAGEKKTEKGSGAGAIKFKQGEMSREDAELLLEAFRMRDLDGAVLADKARKGRSPVVEKDW